ncbi:MAG: hydroxymethylbilane synthase [bacterium]|nr:hydroxymethylbilane synthase [bacterium]
MKTTIKIGTRKSALAMAQTELVIQAIKRVHPDVSIEIITMTTKGDKILNQPLIAFGGKAVFVSEFEEAIADGTIDFAVHSAKDMPMELLEGLDVVAVLERADPRDVLVRVKGDKRQLNTIGTSSLRRQMQVKEYYPMADCCNIRGNVGTRLEKMKNGQYDGIILAMAGLSRLGLLDSEEYEFEVFDSTSFLPAAGQGIIAIEGRKDDFCSKLLEQINHKETAYRLQTEREVLRLLEAGCHEPVAVYSEIHDDTIQLSVLYEQDGKVVKWNGTDQVQARLALAAEAVNRIRGMLHE